MTKDELSSVSADAVAEGAGVLRARLGLKGGKKPS
jgi:hypothetical protein